MSRKKIGDAVNNRVTAVETYIVVRPITYGEPEERHEAGAEVSDIPAASIPWLVEQGHIKLKEGVE